MMVSTHAKPVSGYVTSSRFSELRPCGVLHAHDQGLRACRNVHRTSDAAGAFRAGNFPVRKIASPILEIARTRHPDAHHATSDAHPPDERKKRPESTSRGLSSRPPVEIFFADFARRPIPEFRFRCGNKRDFFGK